MALTDHERRLLNDLEADLAQVSSRPQRSHLVAGCAAHRWQAIATAAIVAALISVAVLTSAVSAAFVGAAAVVLTAQVACVIWHHAVNLAAGD